MTENLRTPENSVGKLAPITGILYILFSFAIILTSFGIIPSSNTSTVLTSGMLGTLFIAFFYYAFLMSLGENGNKGALLVIPPVVFAAVVGFALSNTEVALFSIIEVLSATLTSAVLYNGAYKKALRSDVCSHAAFVLLVFSLLEITIMLFLISSANNISMTTLLFDTTERFIKDYSAVYMELLEKAVSSGAVGAADLAISMEYIEAEITSVIALLPAILFIVYFCFAFVFTYIADALTKRLGILPEYRFGRYEVSTTVNVLFHIFGIIVILSTFFEENVSAFSIGMLSVVLTLLPHYIILGLRRLFVMLRKRLTVLASIIVSLLIVFVGLYLFSTILILVIVMFGTTEYRLSKHGSAVK